LAAEGCIKVAVIDKTIYFKPVGVATQQNCLGAPDFLSVMFRVGCIRFAVDLEQCEAMDSTFLGVLAFAATCLPNQGRKTVVIFNANERNLRDIRTVGLAPLVTLCKEHHSPPPGLQLKKIDSVHVPATERERVEKIKHLHEILIHLNKANKEKFSSFIAMLEKELESA